MFNRFASKTILNIITINDSITISHTHFTCTTIQINWECIVNWNIRQIANCTSKRHKTTPCEHISQHSSINWRSHKTLYTLVDHKNQLHTISRDCGVNIPWSVAAATDAVYYYNRRLAPLLVNWYTKEHFGVDTRKNKFKFILWTIFFFELNVLNSKYRRVRQVQ